MSNFGLHVRLYSLRIGLTSARVSGFIGPKLQNRTEKQDGKRHFPTRALSRSGSEGIFSATGWQKSHPSTPSAIFLLATRVEERNKSAVIVPELRKRPKAVAKRRTPEGPVFSFTLCSVNPKPEVATYPLATLAVQHDSCAYSRHCLTSLPKGSLLETSWKTVERQHGHRRQTAASPDITKKTRTKKDNKRTTLGITRLRRAGGSHLVKIVEVADVALAVGGSGRQGDAGDEKEGAHGVS